MSPCFLVQRCTWCSGGDFCGCGAVLLLQRGDVMSSAQSVHPAVLFGWRSRRRAGKHLRQGGKAALISTATPSEAALVLKQGMTVRQQKEVGGHEWFFLP